MTPRSVCSLARISMFPLACFLLLGTSCSNSNSNLKPAADLSMIQESGLAFIRAGETTREEIIYRLGIPVARFESDRILVYQLSFGENGRVRLYAPRMILVFGALGYQDWERGTYSLVCVFREDGVLLKLSLVGAE